MSMTAASLLDRYPIISDQIGRPALAVVLHALESALQQGITGDVAEFGCYIGTTSLFIQRLLEGGGEKRHFYAYDSFQGLPAKSSSDSSAIGIDFKGGELAVSKKQFYREFQKAGLRAPITHKAWFKDLQPEQLPAHIAFAFLDGDFYESILDSLKLVWPRLSAGAIIAIDDYHREALPGVERAVEEFLRGKSHHLRYEQHIAIITT